MDAHHQVAHQAACEGMVLLKNNGILPLQNPHHIAVIGRAAESAHFQGGGSSHIVPTRVAVPFNELKSQAGNAELSYAEGYPTDKTFRQDLIDQAAALAAAADVAILYIALPTFVESEGYDRKDLNLTMQQVALIKAVSAVQPNTVVVLNNGSPVVMSEWLDGVAAVLEGYMMGQAGGEAIADILYGKVNPSGKLAETFPLRLADIPTLVNWPGEAGKVRYSEGLYIGYRYYDLKDLPVLFPFGYGLSYTTFAYSSPRVNSSSFKDVDGVIVSVDVTNTGKVAGKEIVQVYVHDQASTLSRPQKELKGFAKVSLLPGETKTVSIKLDFRAFAYYHPQYHRWVAENGEFDLLIGASSTDIRHTLTVKLNSTQTLPCILNNESTLNEWLADPRGKVVMTPIYGLIETEIRKQFGGQDRYGKPKADDMLGMGGNIMDMINEMPLLSVLMFIPKSLPKPAEEIMEGMLLQAHSLDTI